MTHKYKLAANGITHGVGVFDPHFPYEDRKSFDAVLKYIDETKPQVFIFGGDIVDLDIVSNKAKRREIEGKRLAKDFMYARTRMAEIAQAIPDATLFALEGNHDERMERYIDDNPELEGIMEVPRMLGMDEPDCPWVWIPSWRKGDILQIGKAHFIHGYSQADHHAKKTVSDYGVNIFYGDMHDIQRYSKIMQGDDSTIMAQSCGCLCRYDMPYLLGKPTRWQRGFLDIYWRPNGQFWHNVIPIFNNEFVANGKVYK